MQTGCKRDVEGAFRRRWICPDSFGDLATEVNGYTILEASFIFGAISAPAVYNLASQAISQRHNQAKWVLEHALGRLEKGAIIKCSSITYCDDGVLQSPELERALATSTAEYESAMEACLGDKTGPGGSAVSTKDKAEMLWEECQTTMGHKCNFNEGYFYPGPAKWNLLQVKLADPAWNRGNKTLTAATVYSTFGVGLWVASVSPILLPYIMELKRPLEATDGHVVPEQLVDPVRPGESPDNAWNELWSAVEFLRLILKLYQHDSPEMRTQTWELLPLMERMQLPGFIEQMRLSSKDACLTGMGGFCFHGPGYYWRKPVPKWAVDEVRKVMAEGHSQRFSEEVTIAILEAVATVVNEDLWGGGEIDEHGRATFRQTVRNLVHLADSAVTKMTEVVAGECPVKPEELAAMQSEVTQAERDNPIGHWVLSDNTDDVVWFSKHRAMPRRAAFLVRVCDLIRLQRCHHWIISYLPTKANHLSDLLSRSYEWKDDRWVDKPEVMQEFFDECSKMGYHAPKEVEVKDETIDLLLPQNFKPTSAAQWASVIEKLNALHKEEPSEQPPTVGTDRGLSLEQPARHLAAMDSEEHYRFIPCHTRI